MIGRASIALLLLAGGGLLLAQPPGRSSAARSSGSAEAVPMAPLPTAPPADRPSGAPQQPRPAQAYFEADFLQRSDEYNRTLVAYALNARAIRWAVYLSLLMLPFLPALSRRLGWLLPGRENVRVFLLAWVVLAVSFAAVLPVSFAAGYVHEHRYGLSRQDVGGWLADAAKAFLLWGTVMALLTALYFLLRRRLPRAGWIVFAAAAIVAATAGTVVYPIVVDPIFNRFRPLADAGLRRDLVSMAAREGVEVGEVLVMDASVRTTRENAYFTGLGGTKRVVLWDNLLENASPAEVRQVFAHELGHWSRGHILRGLTVAAAAIPPACLLLWMLHARLSRIPRLGLAGPADPAGIPLVWLLLSVGIFVTDPVANAVSRRFEREADLVSLELSDDAATFVESQRRMAVTNLGWVDPPAIWKWLFWTHPTTLERIRMAEGWRELP